MKIHHIGYLTKDLKSTVKEFCKLGYSIEQDTLSDSHRKINICFLINGDYRVEVIEPHGPQSPIYGLLKKYKNTPYHICYLVADIQDAINELKLRGEYIISQEPLEAPAIKNAKVAFLIGSDIGIIELLEEKDIK